MIPGRLPSSHPTEGVPVNRWASHAAAWLLVALGGVAMYVAAEQDPWLGLALAAGTILIDIGVLFVHEDIKRARDPEEDPPSTSA